MWHCFIKLLPLLWLVFCTPLPQLSILPSLPLLSEAQTRGELQKQPPRGFLKKRCSENMQQIYRRTPMPTCDWMLNEKYVKTRVINENISKDMGKVEFIETILIYFTIRSWVIKAKIWKRFDVFVPVIRGRIWQFAWMEKYVFVQTREQKYFSQKFAAKCGVSL